MAQVSATIVNILYKLAKNLYWTLFAHNIAIDKDTFAYSLHAAVIFHLIFLPFYLNDDRVVFLYLGTRPARIRVTLNSDYNWRKTSISVMRCNDSTRHGDDTDGSRSTDSDATRSQCIKQIQEEPERNITERTDGRAIEQAYDIRWCPSATIDEAVGRSGFDGEPGSRQRPSLCLGPST